MLIHLQKFEDNNFFILHSINYNNIKYLIEKLKKKNFFLKDIIHFFYLTPITYSFFLYLKNYIYIYIYIYIYFKIFKFFKHPYIINLFEKSPIGYFA